MLTQLQLRAMHLITNDNVLLYTFDRRKYYPAVGVMGVDKDILHLIESASQLHHALYDILTVLENVRTDYEQQGDAGGVSAMDDCTRVALTALRMAQYGLDQVASEQFADVKARKGRND